ncbi:3571_t:CDS:1, partial [Funneliformis geosporum]
NIHGEDDPTDILVGKKWLEGREKESPKPPIAENFPQSPKNPDSDIVKNKPLITAGKPDKQDNSPLLIKAEPKLTITSYQPQLLIGRISPKNQEEFSLNASKQLP